MLGDLVAGFCDEQRAGAVEIADGLDLVVLGHQGHRLSNQLVGLPDEIVEQVGHVERDALWLLLLELIGRDESVQRAVEHLHHRNIVIDAEDRGYAARFVPDVDGRGF